MNAREVLDSIHEYIKAKDDSDMMDDIADGQPNPNLERIAEKFAKALTA
ncbi:hypothetical protein [Glutamicibacter sp.]